MEKNISLPPTVSKRQKFFHFMCVFLAGDKHEQRASNILPEKYRIKGFRLWLYNIFSHLNYVEGQRLVEKHKTYTFRS